MNHAAKSAETGAAYAEAQAEVASTKSTNPETGSQLSPDSQPAHNSDRTSEEVQASILLSVKKALGLVPEYEPFDDILIMHINAVLSILHQIGVGPDEPFHITGEGEPWSDFITQEATEEVRSYMYYKVKLLFDPPTANSSMFDAYDRLTKEYEWRLRVAGDEDRRLHHTVSASNRESTSGDYDELPNGGDNNAGW